jgi:hypothetical protein
MLPIQQLLHLQERYDRTRTSVDRRNEHDMRLDTCVHLEHGRRCTLGLATECELPAACQACEKYEGMVRGMGDMFARFAKATGIEAVAKRVEHVTGKPCGCGGRRAALNRMMPFGSQEPER